MAEDAAAGTNATASTTGDAKTGATGDTKAGTAGSATGADKTAATLAADKGADKAAADKPGSFPDNWRDLIAGGDTKKLDTLKRYASPVALFDGHMQLRARMDSGELKGPFPKDATPEAQAAWRKAQGVPDKWESYDITMSDGLVVGEADMPIVDEMRKAMFEMHAPQALMSKMLTTYYQARNREAEAQADKDLDTKVKAEDALRQEWGTEYTPNVNALKNFLATTFGDNADLLAGARLADGTAIFNHPIFVRAFAQIAREMNPLATTVGHGGAQGLASAQEEIARLEKMMGDPASEYWRGDNAAKNQQRYRDLVGAVDAHKKRAA